jgi:hypothetical protein
VSWYRLKNAAGEIRYAASLDGEDTQAWVPLALARCPEPYETVADDGTITADAALEAAIEDDGRIGRLTKRAMFWLAVRTAKSQLIDDLAATGVVTQVQAAKLRARL